MEAPNPYNPLTKQNLAASIANKVLHQEPRELPSERFIGAGVYLIYYTGDFDAYAPIARANRGGRLTQPIYVGKAVPAGGRKGGQGLDTPHDNALHKRLADHAKSIGAAKNLRLADFKSRWLVVDGFGNHQPGKGRTQGMKPMWDVLHPGREWASELESDVPADRIRELIKPHLATVTIPPSDIVS